ncbi:DUF29 family protein [Dechloromonas hortensis]|uniref:DUF29 family protein n=1 Tax=Dechloromonas hortensis TaxID=337779 RepID=UPI0012913DA5
MLDQISDLLATLLEGRAQPSRRDAAWEVSVRQLRTAVRHQVALNPGLANLLDDPDWCAEIWADAIALAADETGLGTLPDACPWSMHHVLNG